MSAASVSVRETAVSAYLATGRTGMAAALAAIEEVSPLYVGDALGGLSHDVYARMLTDAEVHSAFRTWKLSVLDPGVAIVPSAGRADAESARDEMARLVRDLLAGFDLDGAVCELLDGAAYGVQLSEIVLRSEGGALVPDRVVGVDPRRYLLAKDRDGRFIGAVSTAWLSLDDEAALRATLDVPDDLRTAFGRAIVPEWKLLRYAREPKSGSMVGASILRPAYEAWFCKTRLLPEYLRFLARFGSPSIFATTPISPTLTFDAQGLPVVPAGSDRPLMTDPLGDLLSRLLAWQNAQVAVGPDGTTIQYLEPKTSGDALASGLEYFDRQIHQAILGTSQATKEAARESRSSKDVAQDVVGFGVSQGRREIAAALSPLMRLLVRVNRGDAYVGMAPVARIASTERQDMGSEAAAFAALEGAGLLSESQRAWWYARLGMPAPTPQEIEEERVAREDVRRERARLYLPTAP